MSLPFLSVCRHTNRLRRSRAEVCWLGFAAGVAFTVIVFALVTLASR